MSGEMLKTGDIIAAGGAQGLQVIVRLEEEQSAHYSASWESWTGRKPDFIHGFMVPGATWDGMVNWVKTQCDVATQNGQKIAWALTTCSNTSTFEDFLAGTYDRHFNRALQLILAQNPEGPIPVRINWEGNIPTWRHKGVDGRRDPYRAVFERAAQMCKDADERFEVEWCLAHDGYLTGGAVFDAMDPATGLWPANEALVDVIGVDFYCTNTNIGSGYGDFKRNAQEVSPRNILGAGHPHSLRKIAAFARSKGKRMRLSEVGCGFDGSAFWRDVLLFARNPRNNVIGIGIWDKNAEPAYPANTPVENQTLANVIGYKHNARLTPWAPLPKYHHDFARSRKSILYYLYGKASAGPVKLQGESEAYLARSSKPVPAGSVGGRSWLEIVDYIYREGKREALNRFLDILFFPGGPNDEACLINYNTPGGYSTTIPRPAGRWSLERTNGGNTDPIWEALPGSQIGAGVWRGDGATQRLRLAGVNFGTGVTNQRMTQTDAHISLYALDFAPNGGAQAMYAGNATACIGVSAAPNSRWVGRLGNITTESLTTTDAQGAGHIMMTRTGPAAGKAYHNGATSKLITSAVADQATATKLASDDFRLLGASGLNQFTTARLLMFTAGSAPDDREALELARIATWYRNQVMP